MSLLLSSLGVLAAGAILSLLMMRLPRGAMLTAMIAMLAASVLSATAAVAALSGKPVGPMSFEWPMPMGSAILSMDGLSAWFVLTISILAAAVSVYSISYMQGEAAHGSLPMFGVFMCLLVASMFVVVCAADAVLFLVGWEFMTLSAFFLVSFHDRRAEVRHAAWMYLVATHLGTALFLLPMFAMLVVAAGSTSYAAFAAHASEIAPRTLVLIFLFGVVGFGTKAGFMPMHIWLPNAHPAAPTPVSAFLSGVVIKTGIYGLLRLLAWLPPLPMSCAVVLLAMGMISGVLGVLYALAQHDLKRLLAYHSVENIGIIGVGIGIGMLGQTWGMPLLAAAGYAGAILHVMNHAVFKGLLFLSAGAVMHSTGTGEIDRLGGLAKRTPVNAMLFLIAAVSICGLPPFNGFVSEWLIYRSLFGGSYSMSGSAAIVSVLGLMSLAMMGGLALACFAKVFGVVFLGEARDGSIEAHPTPRAMSVAMALLAGLCVIIGMYPTLAINLLGAGVRTITRQAAAEYSGTMQVVMGPAGMITVFGLLLLGLIGLLILIRGRPMDASAAARQPTWGCGYGYPTARMQYTASSFAWPLVNSFASVLWPKRHLEAPAGPFPESGHFATHTDDVAESDFFAPLLRGIARLARMAQTMSLSGELKVGASIDHDDPAHVRPWRLTLHRALSAMRRGSIQMCITYIVMALLVLFIVEAISFPKPGPAAPAADQKVSMSDTGGIGQ